MKSRIAEILEPSSKNDFLSRSFNIFIIALIILNILAVALESMHDVSVIYSGSFKAFELFSMTVFTIEYVTHVSPDCPQMWPTITGPCRIAKTLVLLKIA